MMQGCELVTDQESKTPDPVLFGNVWERTKNYGLLVGKGGRFGTRFRFQPPQCITKEDVDFAIDVLDRSLGEEIHGN